jgi:glycosyltransferase involved in cell wall biosynthesis
MLSILIPIFNYEVSRFVLSLKKQADLLEIPYEIICFDDCSDQKTKTANRVLKVHRNLQYEELQHKAGRAKIRNLMAEAAQYPYLLFLDCDQQVETDDFLKKYAAVLEKGTVFCGGRSYYKTPPADLSYLRWYYGTKREVCPASQREKNPYKSFLSCNFLIDKQLFQSIGFNEKLLEYGHEDTLFGLELKNRQVPVIHIDNPVIHEGLEDAQVFLEKSKQALLNLAFLYLKNQKELSASVKILHWYEKVKRLHLTNMLLWCFKRFKKNMEKNIYSNKPSLIVFDIYRLGYFIELVQAQQKLIKSSGFHSPS